MGDERFAVCATMEVGVFESCCAHMEDLSGEDSNPDWRIRSAGGACRKLFLRLILFDGPHEGCPRE